MRVIKPADLNDDQLRALLTRHSEGMRAVAPARVRV
jgi:hypothetical protein